MCTIASRSASAIRPSPSPRPDSPLEEDTQLNAITVLCAALHRHTHTSSLHPQCLNLLAMMCGPLPRAAELVQGADGVAAVLASLAAAVDDAVADAAADAAGDQAAEVPRASAALLPAACEAVRKLAPEFDQLFGRSPEPAVSRAALCSL